VSASRSCEIAGLAWDGDRPDAALEPDPPGLHVADREVILDPVLIVERVHVDLGCARGDVVEQAAEAIGGGVAPTARAPTRRGSSAWPVG
jgi:hypothetical protein